MSPQEYLQEMWRRERCPIINGVTFSTGEVHLVTLSFVQSPIFGVQAQSAGCTSLQGLTQRQQIDLRENYSSLNGLC